MACDDVVSVDEFLTKFIGLKLL